MDVTVHWRTSWRHTTKEGVRGSPGPLPLLGTDWGTGCALHSLLAWMPHSGKGMKALLSVNEIMLYSEKMITVDIFVILEILGA